MPQDENSDSSLSDTTLNNGVKNVQSIFINGGDTSATSDDRYEFLKNQFDDYRSRANKMFQSKDKTIESLHERLRHFLENGDQKNSNVNVKALENEKCKLTQHMEKLEKEYNQEKSEWSQEKEIFKKKIAEQSLMIDNYSNSVIYSRCLENSILF